MAEHRHPQRQQNLLQFSHDRYLNWGLLSLLRQQIHGGQNRGDHVHGARQTPSPRLLTLRQLLPLLRQGAPQKRR